MLVTSPAREAARTISEVMKRGTFMDEVLAPGPFKTSTFCTSFKGLTLLWGIRLRKRRGHRFVALVIPFFKPDVVIYSPFLYLQHLLRKNFAVLFPVHLLTQIVTPLPALAL